MKLWSVLSWQACSCLGGVTTVRLGAVGDARIAASGEAHLRSLCRWAQVTVEEVMTTTAYLDLFLRSISEPALLETFLRFILLHQHENVHILDTLTSRINTPFRVRRAPVEGKLWLRTQFRRVCFWDKTVNILFFLFTLLLFSFQPLLFCFGRDELDCFAAWSPSVWEVEVTAFSRQFSQFVWVDTFLRRTSRMCFRGDKEQGMGLKLK